MKTLIAYVSTVRPQHVNNALTARALPLIRQGIERKEKVSPKSLIAVDSALTVTGKTGLGEYIEANVRLLVKRKGYNCEQSNHVLANAVNEHIDQWYNEALDKGYVLTAICVLKIFQLLQHKS